MEKTHENKIKIFAIGIADYIPYSHTLTEILMSYSNELGIEYTLDMDPVVSAINILDKFVNINSFSIFIKEKYIQAKQDYMKIGNINSL